MLFELGRYAEAETFINEALKNLDTEKGNASIYEHAGDIYYMRKKSAEALKMWRKAKGLGGDLKTLDEKDKNRKVYSKLIFTMRKMLKHIRFFCMAVVAVVLLGACSSSKTAVKSGNTTKEVSNTEVNVMRVRRQFPDSAIYNS